MEGQFTTLFPQQPFVNPSEGPCFQIPPFGVVLQPVPITSPPSPLSPLSPTSPIQMELPTQQHISKQGITNPISILSPLSVGGFLYTPSPYPPTPASPTHSAFLLSAPVTPNKNSPYVSPEILARQEKLEKYREKRAKRNYNRPSDQIKRERANARTRDQNGQFTSESKREKEKMRQALEASQQEAFLLKSKLEMIEQELKQLRQKAEEEQEWKASVQRQLEAQQKVNQDLLRENSLLWSTVPTDEVFNTINPSKPPVFLDAFKQKIDFSAIELNWTDSPHLEAARLEESDFDQRWEEMTFFAGANS